MFIAEVQYGQHTYRLYTRQRLLIERQTSKHFGHHYHQTHILQQNSLLEPTSCCIAPCPTLYILWHVVMAKTGSNTSLLFPIPH